jgi:hypothetical protein
MKTNSSLNVTVTLNASDIVELIEEGELKDNGVVIGTTEPERKQAERMLDSCTHSSQQ